MEGRGYDLIVFASVLPSSRGEPGMVVGYERNTVTIAKAAKVIPFAGFEAGTVRGALHNHEAGRPQAVLTCSRRSSMRPEGG